MCGLFPYNLNTCDIRSIPLLLSLYVFREHVAGIILCSMPIYNEWMMTLLDIPIGFLKSQPRIRLLTENL